MILDSSAVVAVINAEPEHEALLAQLMAAPLVAIGAPTVVEIAMVLSTRLGTVARTVLARFIDEGEVEVLPFGPAHWPVAADAFERFGRGRHPARLNFGDCLTYACARIADQPLLCIGDDFAQTDLELVALR